MQDTQVFSGYQSEIKGSFEYAGTWSEEHRHQCEVRSIAKLPDEEIPERIKKIGDKRGQRAAEIMKRDVQAERYKIVMAKQKVQPAKTNKTPSLF